MFNEYLEKEQQLQTDNTFFDNNFENETTIDVEILSNKNIKVYGVPDGEDFVTVTLRPVSMRDYDLIATVQTDPKEGLYKMLASLIIDWGETGKIDSLRLKTSEKDEAILLLDQICQRFCLKRYRFNVRNKSKGFQNGGLSSQ